MSMNGHLLEVDADLARRLRAEPGLAAEITGRYVFAGLGGFADPADVHAVVDSALLGLGALGCLWSLVPRFARRWLLGRFLKVPPPAAVDAASMAADLQRLRADLEGEDDDEELSPKERAQVAELEARIPKPDAPPVAGVGEHLPLHKDWHVLHAILTGSAEEAPGPAGDAILGGDELGEDLGYGPAKLLDAARAAAVAAWLRDLGPEGIVGRFRPRALDEEVYGADFAVERGYVEEVRMRANQLCRFYAGVAERGGSVLIWIS